MTETVCPQCKRRIAAEAHHCPHCGYSFEGYARFPAEEPSPEQAPGLLGALSGAWRRLLGATEPAAGAASNPYHEQPTEPLQRRPAAASGEAAPAAAEGRAGRAPAAGAGQPGAGTLLGDRFHVAQRFELESCTFYQAYSGEQPQQPLLIREMAPQRPLAAAAPVYRRLGHPNIWPHQAILEEGQRRYVVLPYPGNGWRSLAKVRTPLASVQQAVSWTIELGRALSELHRHGLAGWPEGLRGREGLIIVQEQVRVADATLCQALRDGMQQGDIRALASFLFFLAVGSEWQGSGAELEQAPAAIQPALRRAVAGEYPNLARLLEELAAATPAEAATAATLERVRPLPATETQAAGMGPAGPHGRSLRQLHGYATHPGRKREMNEDFVAALNYSLDQSGLSEPLGLYVVADGMGGHAGGEKASRGSVQRTFLRFVEEQILPELRGQTRKLSPETPVQKLEAMVKQANELVFQSRRASGSDRGTTMTAAMVVGSRGYLANVGDSRIYRWRRGTLEPVTSDHSLVARLVQAGQIQPDEVYSHPQRNQIYRSLGDRAEVEVDTYECNLQQGDRLLLCSDGLWEMVRDPQVRQLLEANPSPQAAADQLVEAANDNGGEDNISVIVVNIE